MEKNMMNDSGKISTMITADKIVAFIDKAMKTNHAIFDVSVGYRLRVVIKINNERIIFSNDGLNENNIICITTKNCFYDYKIKCTDLEFANFKLAVLKAKEYCNKQITEYFNNFFNETKLTDINDLDFEEID